jgi:ribosomal protein S14
MEDIAGRILHKCLGKNIKGDKTSKERMPDFEAETTPNNCAKCGRPLDHNYGIDLCKKCLRGK